MHTLPSLPLAGILGLGTAELVVVLVILMGPVMVVAIVASALYFKHRQRQEWNEIVRLALEKGQPIPPYPGHRVEETSNTHWHAPRSTRKRDITGALVLLAVGAAIFLGIPPHQGNRGLLIFAYVPAFIGVALLLSALFDAISSRKNDAPGSQPPKS